MWQVANIPPNKRVGWVLGIRAFVIKAGIDSALKICTQAGWFEMSATKLVPYANYFHVAIPAGAGLYGILWAFASSALGTFTKRQKLELIYGRIGTINKEEPECNTIMHVEEAFEVHKIRY